MLIDNEHLKNNEQTMKKPIEPKKLSQAINFLAAKYIYENDGQRFTNGTFCKCETAWDINNGLCDEFASELLDLLGGETDDQFALTNDMFIQLSYDEAVELWEGEEIIKTENGSGWSSKMLLWHTTPPVKDIRKVDDLPSHTWVSINKKYYDAECSEGVNTPWELPIFQKFFKDYQ